VLGLIDVSLAETEPLRVVDGAEALPFPSDPDCSGNIVRNDTFRRFDLVGLERGESSLVASPVSKLSGSDGT